MIKIAIHNKADSFSDRWIDYCELKGIKYKLVNCYSTDVISQTADCCALMWHFNQENYKDVLFAKQLLFALELSGKKVFPNFKTCWHFDDKVAQKYLFEAIEAPMVPGYVFYSENEAINWINNTSFPKVFKLRGGSTSQNVKLVNSHTHARRLVYKAFNRGFSQFDKIGYIKERIYRYHELNDNFIGVLKGILRLIIPTEFAKMHAREKGYVFFQDFIPNNNFDIRVIVIENKAFAVKRMVRRNDFRASGSGKIVYEEENFPIDTIKLSLTLADKLQSQCIAFDFVYDSSENPLIVEVSYGFSVKPYDACEGYWDKDLNFHKGPFIPQYWMVESVIKNENT